MVFSPRHNQYTEEELRAAVAEARRIGKVVAVHANGEPGTGFAAKAGVVSIDHASQLSPETMRIMKEQWIPAVPTFAISQYFADHAPSPAVSAQRRKMLAYHASEFKKQLAAGVPIAMGSDVGPFPHGTQAREFELMVQYGSSPLQAVQAGTVNAARLLGWGKETGTLQPGYFADIIAVPGNPLENVSALRKVQFVMKGGAVYRNEVAQ